MTDVSETWSLAQELCTCELICTRPLRHAVLHFELLAKSEVVQPGICSL